MQTWTEWLTARLRAANSPYAAFYHSALETQFQPVIDDDALDHYFGQWPMSGNPRPVRIPADGGTAPRNNDGPLDFHPELIAAAGTSWWNWRDGVTEGCYFDFDYGHGLKGLDEAGIMRVDEWATATTLRPECHKQKRPGAALACQVDHPATCEDS